MKSKLTLLLVGLFTTIIVFAQNDQYGGAVNADADGDSPGPFTKYGWIIMIALIATAYFRNSNKSKKRLI